MDQQSLGTLKISIPAGFVMIYVFSPFFSVSLTQAVFLDLDLSRSLGKLFIDTLRRVEVRKG